jgi:hypothetical protein
MSNISDIRTFKETIKHFQENPEEKLDSKTLFFKSKLIEIVKEKENIETQNKILIEKIEKQEKINENKENVQENKECIEKNKEIFRETNEFKEKVDQINVNESNSGMINSENLQNFAFTEDQLKEFTYILIKNFEANDIDFKKLNEIFEEESKNTDEIILNTLAMKISTVMNM